MKCHSNKRFGAGPTVRSAASMNALGWAKITVHMFRPGFSTRIEDLKRKIVTFFASTLTRIGAGGKEVGRAGAANQRPPTSWYSRNNYLQIFGVIGSKRRISRSFSYLIQKI
jgi:hypothetical protein